MSVHLTVDIDLKNPCQSGTYADIFFFILVVLIVFRWENWAQEMNDLFSC